MSLRWIAGLLTVLLLAATGTTAQTNITIKGDLQAAQELDAAWQRLEKLRSYRMKFAFQTTVMLEEVVKPDRWRILEKDSYGRTQETIVVGKEYRVLLHETEEDRRKREEERRREAQERITSLVSGLISIFTGGGFFAVADLILSQIRSAAQERQQDALGVWLCPKGPWPYDPQALAAQAGPPPLQEETYGRLGEVMIEGARTHGYTIETRIGGQHPSTLRHRVYVLVDNGLLRRIELLDALTGTATTPADWSKKADTTWDYYDHDAPITIEFSQCGQRQR